MSSDVYMGQQCLAAEMIGGIVRGMVRWEPDEREEGRKLVLDSVAHVMKQTETESVAIWASCMRFCIYNRHPRKVTLCRPRARRRLIVMERGNDALPSRRMAAIVGSCNCKGLTPTHRRSGGC